MNFAPTPIGATRSSKIVASVSLSTSAHLIEELPLLRASIRMQRPSETANQFELSAIVRVRYDGLEGSSNSRLKSVRRSKDAASSLTYALANGACSCNTKLG